MSFRIADILKKDDKLLINAIKKSEQLTNNFPPQISHRAENFTTEPNYANSLLIMQQFINNGKKSANSDYSVPSINENFYQQCATMENNVPDKKTLSYYNNNTDKNQLLIFPYNPILMFNFSSYWHQYPKKRNQIRFSTSQTDALENKFVWQKYLNPEDRKLLAYSLKLSDRQVKTWFQNRRAKWRRNINNITSSSTDQKHNSN